MVIGVLWAPFPVAGRVRNLFDSVPPAEWYVNYPVWIPLPAAVWGVLFESALPVSRDVRAPTEASPAYVAGVDGIVVASLVSIVLWPVLLLYTLPARGIEWDPSDYGLPTAVLVVGTAVWYLSLLVGPAYVISVFAGFGDATSGT